MENEVEEQTENDLPPVSNAIAAIHHFQEGLASGKHWYIALLETIGLWTDEVENFQGRNYRYLIEGEAFDWLLLAERICETVNGMVPEAEKHALLFQNKPPLRLSSEEFRDLIGSRKYHQYLNFFYGVTVEEALVQAVREEVRKERHSNAWFNRHGEEDEVFVRIYDSTRLDLWKLFCKEKHYRQPARSSLAEMKEFTYWCFKFRVRECEKAKVASDTNKALEWLRENGFNC
jgi:hypothetical protein